MQKMFPRSFDALGDVYVFTEQVMAQAGIGDASAFSLRAEPVPNQPGIFYYSLSPAGGGDGVPLFNGIRCVGSPGFQMYRLPPNFASGNVAFQVVDLSNPPIPSGQILPGSTWYFQLWFRDPGTPPTGADYSNAWVHYF